MKKNHTNLFGVLLSFLLWIPTISGQDCFYCTASSANVSNGSQHCVDISVHGFTDISSMQFSLIWDPLVLDFVDVQNVGLPPSGTTQFGETLVDSGVLTFFWLDAQNGHDLPDRTTAFSVCFDVIGTLGQLSDVDFSDVATDIEVYNSDLEEVEFHSLAGVVAVGGTPVNTIQMDGCEISTGCSSDFTLVVEGGADPLVYSWAGPGGFSSSMKHLTNLIRGDYTITVTDNNGVSATANFQLGNEILGIADTTITEVKCFGFNTGAVDISIVGGNGPVEILWSNNSTFEDISGVGPGDYSVTITDSTNCQLIQTFTVPGNDPIELVSIVVDCESDAGNDGFVTVDVTGGAGGYSFDWSFGPSTSTGIYGGLAPGSYEVSVSDQFNCPYIIVPFGVSAGITAAEDFSACSGQGVVLGVEAPSGESFSWSPATFLDCTDCPNPVATADADIAYIVNVVDTSGCVEQDTVHLTVTEDCVWPGDTDLSKDVSHLDLLNIGLGVSETGPVRIDANTSWTAQVADDWSIETPISMVNLKYADTNGDGTINAMDTLAIAANWGEMHNLHDPSDESKQKPTQEIWSSVSGGPAFFINTPDTLLANTAVELPIELGSSTSTIAEIYGLAFSIYYDPTLVVAGSVKVNLTGSWLGTPGPDLIMMHRNDPAAGRLDVAITGMDGVNRSGFGQIGVLTLQLQPLTGSEVTTFRIGEEKLIDNVEQEITVAAITSNTTIVDMISGVHALDLQAPLEVFPNPAGEVVYIRAGNQTIESVELFDVTGQRKSFLKTSLDYQTLFVPEDLKGTFLLRVQTDKGVFLRRLVLVR